MASRNKILGKLGEKIAENHLIKSGYIIECKNFKCKFGEIDIIAKKDDNLIFIEVKTRTNKSYGYPVESIDRIKIRKIKSVADFFLVNNKKYFNFNISLDCIFIFLKREFFNKNNTENIKNSINNFIISNVCNGEKIFNNKNIILEHIKDTG
jgi:putative endonuclease